MIYKAVMNRILLIGNGFDLAHGLKTSYKDFIIDFWERKAKLVYDEYTEHCIHPIIIRPFSFVLTIQIL